MTPQKIVSEVQCCDLYVKMNAIKTIFMPQPSKAREEVGGGVTTC